MYRRKIIFKLIFSNVRSAALNDSVSWLWLQKLSGNLSKPIMLKDVPNNLLVTFLDIWTLMLVFWDWTPLLDTNNAIACRSQICGGTVDDVLKLSGEDSSKGTIGFVANSGSSADAMNRPTSNGNQLLRDTHRTTRQHANVKRKALRPKLQEHC